MITQAVKYTFDRKGNLLSREPIGEPYEVPDMEVAKTFLRIAYPNMLPEDAIEVFMRDVERARTEPPSEIVQEGEDEPYGSQPEDEGAEISA
jgi:hypothetical protein